MSGYQQIKVFPPLDLILVLIGLHCPLIQPNYEPWDWTMQNFKDTIVCPKTK